MLTAKIADLVIDIDNKYNYITEKSGDYIVENQRADFTVSASEDEILAEGNEGNFHPEYLEYLAIYRKIAEKILEYNGLLLHGVLMECEGKGILLCAKSGVGKSTHAALWKRLLGEKCQIINGDKPLVRIIDGKIYAYGTPWNGKEGLHQNRKCELFSICFLKRGTENSIRKMEADTLRYILNQVYMPKEKGKKLMKTFDILGKIMDKTQCYELTCNTDITAAQVAYEELIK